MSMTSNTYKALRKIDVGTLVKAEEFWESRGLNPEVLKSFLERLDSSSVGRNPMRAEVLLFIGAQLALVSGDPTFGLDTAAEAPSERPHEFQPFGDNSRCATCNRPRAWHLHETSRVSAEDDARGERDA